MKSTEPWFESIKNQEKFNLFSILLLKSGLMWTVLFLALVFVVLVSKDNFKDLIVQRVWIAPTFGFGIALILYIVRWLSPFKIDSGPRGILRIKGDSFVLLPWSEITSYEFNNQKLTLILNDTNKMDFLLPKNIVKETIKVELDENIGKNCG